MEELATKSDVLIFFILVQAQIMFLIMSRS
jgi:hypothetical protein